MESITDVQALVERGNDLLLKGEVAEAAQEFTRAVQLDSSNAAAHLGVAETNLALGSYGIVTLACRKVLELAPGSADGLMAQAILYLLDRRYDAALAELDRADQLAPGRPYLHAMRAYCLRRMGNSYDAQLAASKAARLSGSRELGKLFPVVETPPTAPAAAAPNGAPSGAPSEVAPGLPGRIAYRDQRNWNRASGLQRRMVQSRFFRSSGSVTLTLVIINVVVFAIGALSPSLNYTLQINGAEQGALMQSDPIQYYRLVTAMFLHANLTHIFFNMFSLYVIGALNGTEAIFGKWRYLLIYFAAGIAGGLLEAFIQPGAVAIGASGAIFGIFGAFGAVLFLMRQRLGPTANGILGQWIGLIVLNLVIDV
ncbi:MAG TPA: rhomboid family intramembrane serine protease, partial [Ktedonobacterales bacterium]|nr:rhomboid family intramembrane serine protease [Ktedonobacterales bacterium]